MRGYAVLRQRCSSTTELRCCEFSQNSCIELSVHLIRERYRGRRCLATGNLSKTLVVGKEEGLVSPVIQFRNPHWTTERITKLILL